MAGPRSAFRAEAMAAAGRLRTPCSRTTVVPPSERLRSTTQLPAITAVELTASTAGQLETSLVQTALSIAFDHLRQFAGNATNHFHSKAFRIEQQFPAQGATDQCRDSLGPELPKPSKGVRRIEIQLFRNQGVRLPGIDHNHLGAPVQNGGNPGSKNGNGYHRQPPNRQQKPCGRFSGTPPNPTGPSVFQVGTYCAKPARFCRKATAQGRSSVARWCRSNRRPEKGCKAHPLPGCSKAMDFFV